MKIKEKKEKDLKLNSHIKISLSKEKFKELQTSYMKKKKFADKIVNRNL